MAHAGNLEVRETVVGGLRVRAYRALATPHSSEPALVLVPGLAVTHRYLLPLMRYVAAERPCYALDLPGFGTWRKPGRALSVPDYAELVAAWMDEAGLERPALLGNSLGCEVIVHLAARYPRRVTSLVLTSPSMDPAARTFLLTFWRWLHDVPREPLSLVPLVARDWLLTGPLWMVRGLSTMFRDSIEDVLPQVQAPALVVRGERDAIVPASWAHEVTRLLPRGELAEIPGAVHAVTFDAPDALADLVHAFLVRKQEAAAAVSRETARSLEGA